jgi:tRNA(Ile)-lysidine synthase
MRVSDSLEQKVAGFIRLHGLFAGAGRVLLAVSGGADSTALLHILHSLRAHGVLPPELVCAHVNHQLRGSAGDEDERFVIEQATRLGLPVVTRTVDVRAHATAHRLSIETAARRLRLQALRELAEASGCTWVATGHQKNDNAETLIQRLRRGTGFRGLAGIWPVRQLGSGRWFARPLLDVTRDEIVAYLNRRMLAWREDRTNIDPAYTRNYIRHKLLPALQRESQGPLVEELSELAASARRLYERVRRDAYEAMPQLAQTSDDVVVLTAPRLSSLPELVAVELIRQALVRLGCGEQNLTQDHYRGIMQLTRSLAARVLTLPGGFTARREEGTVILSRPVSRARRAGLAPPVPSDSVVVQIPGETRFADWRIEASTRNAVEFTMEQIKGDKSPFCEYLDLDRVRPPVVVRPRRAGDKFHPLGFHGAKKLGKFLTAARVPREVREHIVVFADREKVIWVCPVRISESAKITQETRRILLLNVVQTGGSE